MTVGRERVAILATAGVLAVAVCGGLAFFVASRGRTSHSTLTSNAAQAHDRFEPAAANQLEEAAAQPLVNEPPTLPLEVDQDRLLSAAGAAVDAFRPDEWEVGALAASLGKDPTQAFEFVRDAIGFDPYPGMLRGAEGTLAARAGNAWDRALLLKALLAESGLTTRFAFATLDPTTATALVKRAHERPARRPPQAEPTGVLGGLRQASRHGRDATMRRCGWLLVTSLQR